MLHGVRLTTAAERAALKAMLMHPSPGGEDPPNGLQQDALVPIANLLGQEETPWEIPIPREAHHLLHATKEMVKLVLLLPSKRSNSKSLAKGW